MLRSGVAARSTLGMSSRTSELSASVDAATESPLSGIGMERRGIDRSGAEAMGSFGALFRRTTSRSASPGFPSFT